eukprot:364815-Chlamydomonas_euryale.AAC.8
MCGGHAAGTASSSESKTRTLRVAMRARPSDPACPVSHLLLALHVWRCCGPQGGDGLGPTPPGWEAADS